MAKFKDYTPPIREDGDWLNLQEGENKIRLVSEFDDFSRHYNPITKKTSTCIGKKHGCPDCAKGSEAKRNFLVWAIDRLDNKIKLFRYGYMIQDQINTLSKSDEYGFDSIPAYDITITKSGKGLETEYKVLPARKDTPLTQEETDAMQVKCKPLSDIIAKMKAKVVPVETPDSVNGIEIPIIEENRPQQDEEIEFEGRVSEKDLPF